LENIKTTEEFLAEVKKDPNYIYNVPEKYQTLEMCLLAVRKSYFMIYAIKKRTPEFYKALVIEIPEMLNLIEEQSEEMCLLAIQRNGMVLKFVRNKIISSKMCMAAIKQNPLAIIYVPIELQTKEMCDFVSQYYKLSFVSFGMHPDDISIRLIQENSINFNDCYHTDKVCLGAVQHDGMLLEHILDPSRDLILEAIKQNPKAIKFVDKKNRKFYPPNVPTKDMCLSLINDKIDCLKHIPHEFFTDDFCELAIRKIRNAIIFIPKNKLTYDLYKLSVQLHPYTFSYVPREMQSEELCKIAIENIDYFSYNYIVSINYLALQFVPSRDQSEQMCINAIKQNKDAIKYVHDVTPTIRKFYNDNYGTKYSLFRIFGI
jgi:hypothetical protein